MDPEGCAAFIRSCTGDKCTADDTRIKNLYAIWDTDKDNILVEENFLIPYSFDSKNSIFIIFKYHTAFLFHL